MKSLIMGVFLGIFAILSILGIFKFNSYPVFYSNQVKIYADTVSPTTGSGFSISISAAGFTTIKTVSVTAQNNTGSISGMPIVVIQSVSISAIVVNILTQNNATTSILGITVLSGSPLQTAASTAGMLLNVHIEGT